MSREEQLNNRHGRYFPQAGIAMGTIQIPDGMLVAVIPDCAVTSDSRPATSFRCRVRYRSGRDNPVRLSGRLSGDLPPLETIFAAIYGSRNAPSRRGSQSGPDFAAGRAASVARKRASAR